MKYFKYSVLVVCLSVGLLAAFLAGMKVGGEQSRRAEAQHRAVWIAHDLMQLDQGACDVLRRIKLKQLGWEVENYQEFQGSAFYHFTWLWPDLEAGEEVFDFPYRYWLDHQPETAGVE